MGKKLTFIESDGFITKPHEIADHFNSYFISKVNIIRNSMLPVNGLLSDSIIKIILCRTKNVNLNLLSLIGN